jgi:hypothetical protein
MTEKPPQTEPSPETDKLAEALNRHHSLDDLLNEFSGALPPDAASLTPEMLARQAQILDRLFTHFLKDPKALERDETVNLALRVQRQCARTVEIARKNFPANELMDE